MQAVHRHAASPRPRKRSAARPRLLLVCPTHRDLRELARIGAEVEVIPHDYASDALERMTARHPPPGLGVEDPLHVLERLEAEHRRHVTAVASADDYPGGTLASVLARRLGLPGTSPRANLLCQHKYYCRVMQRLLAPDATPSFWLMDAGPPAADRLRYPLMLKPVKSFFSVGARPVRGPEGLSRALDEARLPETFFEPFRALFDRHAGMTMGPGRVLGEALVPGRQCTLEGFAWGGEAHVLGIVDSVMYPGTFSFERFEYPSSLPLEVQRRMAVLARRLMRGLGFDHGQFNVELMYDGRRDQIWIIEVNPRMSSQFADLFEKVDGLNTYQVFLDLALGRPPIRPRGRGPHRFAASCVLRTFHDALVRRVPTAAEVEAVLADHPGVRVEILCQEGARLSADMQDGFSYRYAAVSVGGTGREEALRRFEACRRGLPFVLEEVESP